MSATRFLTAIFLPAIFLFGLAGTASAAVISASAGIPAEDGDKECFKGFAYETSSEWQIYGMTNTCQKEVIFLLPVLLYKHRGKLTVEVLAAGSGSAGNNVECVLISADAEGNNAITGNSVKTQGEAVAVQTLTLTLDRTVEGGFTHAVCKMSASTSVLGYEYN